MCHLHCYKELVNKNILIYVFKTIQSYYADIGDAPGDAPPQGRGLAWRGAAAGEGARPDAWRCAVAAWSLGYSRYWCAHRRGGARRDHATGGCSSARPEELVTRAASRLEERVGGVTRESEATPARRPLRRSGAPPGRVRRREVCLASLRTGKKKTKNAPVSSS